MAQVKRTLQGENKQYVRITVPEKVEIIKKLDSGYPAKLLSLIFGVSLRTIYDIKKQKEKIIKYYDHSDTTSGIAQRKSIKPPKSSDLDTILYEWFKQRRSDGDPISGSLLQAKARELHKVLQLKDACTFSTGWLASFKKRHGIQSLKGVEICEEKSSPEKIKSAEDFVEYFSTFVEEEGLSPEQIYNANGMSLFWRCLPGKTSMNSEERAVSGLKEKKDRITSFVCSNSAGTHKCQLMLIGKSAHPRALRGVKELPVIYRSNKKACMTKEIMIDWFKNHFVKEARNHCNKVGLPNDCKIVLVIDNSAEHPKLQTIDNVSILFLPQSISTLIQPMDLEIIHSLKSIYRQEFLKRLIAFNPSVVSDYKKMFNLKDCIFLIAEAWRLVKKDTLINSWLKLWPDSIFLDDGDESEDEFHGFCANEVKHKATELLKFAKAVCKTVPDYLEENQLINWLSLTDELAVTNPVTDQEIIDSVVNSSEIESDSESEDETKISNGQGLVLGYRYLSFLQQNSFISQQELKCVQRLQKRIFGRPLEHDHSWQLF